MAEGGTMDDLTLDTLLPQVDVRALGEDDIFDIIEALGPVAVRWKAIGTALRLSFNRLKEIDSSNDGEAVDCLRDTVAEYVQMNYDVKRHGEPTWVKIVKAVEHSAGGNNRAQAIAIAKDHLVPSKKPAEDILKADGDHSHLLEAFAQKMRAQLEVVKSVSVKSEEDQQHKIWIIKKALSDFFEDTAKSRINPESVRKVLASMYSKDLLLDNTIYEWALEELVTAEKQSNESSLKEQASPKEKLPPLFSKDTVYHACLCSLATSTCTVADYREFFNKKFPEHSLEEAALSRSQDKEDVDRYLIARQGKVYYVAFQSEPLLSDWMKKFSSFEQGIKVQSERIPLRFFVRQLHDGFRIVFTGFSFGGLLAQAVTARMWREPILSAELLQENVACITLGAPMIRLPAVTMVMEETPQFGNTLHSIVLVSDPIPRLIMFLDPRCEEIGSEVLDPTVLKAIQNFQGLFTSALTCYLSLIQESGIGQGTDLDAPNALSSIKVLLNKALPHLLTRLPKVAFIGNIRSIEIDTSKGLTCQKLESELLHRHTELISLSDIDCLSLDMFSKHNAEEYQRAVFRSFIEQPPQPGSPLNDLICVKPSISSVDFRRYGREVSVTVNGDNLWFCNHIQVSRYKTKVHASDTSQHSLQFNYDPENDTWIPTDAECVKVTLSSHFVNTTRNPQAPVSRKVYQFTFRQEQLAKLTPSELMETAYLSALLEQHPHKQLKKFSHRFNTIQAFLERIVSVVPIESIFHTIGRCEDQNIANKCADVVIASQLELPPSLLLIEGIQGACVSQFETQMAESAQSSEKIESTRLEVLGTSEKTFEKQYKKHAKKSAAVLSPVNKTLDKKQFTKAFIANACAHQIGILDQEIYQEVVEIGYPSHPRLVQASHLYRLFSVVEQEAMFWKPIPAVNGLTLDLVYPVTSTAELKSPIEILRNGRPELAKLSQQSLSSGVAANADQQTRLSQLYNSKMLEVVNTIRAHDLKMCTHLLGAFMEEQIKVPLVKSEINTAKALSGLLNAAAVGVWAMFSLSLGDMNAVIRSIPSGSLLVQVKEYIKGIFTEKTATADRNYAGKLQFMVQGMDKTVSCNTHYISYSLERQLIELCKKLNISESTPIEVLVRDWDKIFKEDVLSLVVPSHRSLIASWMKWALMVHNLREELAKYTTVGVVGLVNSGKSLLVSTLFNIEVPVGTTAIKRTTIPFLYNLEGVIDGLDVIDFPGVDDRDDTIPDLCELLLALAQVVVFVVDYRKAHTQSARKWLEMLEDKAVPVLVCLTYADKLYAEHMGEDGSYPEVSHIQQRVAEECSMIKEQLGQVPSHEVQLFSFNQDRDSVLNTPEGRERLKVAGIAPPQAVGDWLAGVFENQLDQEEAATKLKDYVYRK